MAKKPTAFDVIYTTIRSIYGERISCKGRVPDHEFDFKQLRRLSDDKKFCEKTASVLNYIMAEVLMKMGFHQDKIRDILSQIIEEQMFLIDTTMHAYPDGPLRRKAKEKKDEVR